MKRKIAIAAAATLVVAAGFVANALAQTGGNAPALKMGVLNIDAVFTKYTKATRYKKELDDTIAPFKAKADKLKKEIIDIQEYFSKPGADKSKKEAYDKVVVENRRQLEDIDGDVRRLIGKKQQDQLIVLYKDVIAATDAYCKANGITMVFGYGEPFEGNDLYSFMNISRKMQGMGMGAVPIWYNSSLDITDPVVQTLNYNDKSASGNLTGSGK